MSLRFALFASFAGLAALTAAPASAEAPARCEAASFRIYFANGAAALDAAALDTLQAAARNVADCDYAELRISIDAASPYAAARAQAIVTGAQQRGWDAVRVEPRAFHRAAIGPAYADVTMTPDVSDAPSMSLPADVGV